MSNHLKNSSLSPSTSENPGAVPISDTVTGLRAGCFKMKDNTFYFQHDNTAGNDDKILDLRSELGYEGYGIFWALLELLHQNGGVMQMQSKRLAYALQVDEQKLSKVINDFDLFVLEDGNFYSQRLMDQIEYRAAIVDKRRDAGAKGGKSKAIAKQMLSNELPKERKGKERKEEDNKVKESKFIDFWTAYPKKVGKIDAERAWSKAKDKPDIETILKSIADHIKSEQWQKDNGQFIPNPATFINQGRWYDEFKKKTLSVVL